MIGEGEQGGISENAKEGYGYSICRGSEEETG